MSADILKQRKQVIAKTDEELLAELGYKQEFRRAFRPIEVRFLHHLLALGLTSLFCLGFWNCVQHCWSPAFYRVSPSRGSPLPRLFFLTFRSQVGLVLFATEWWSCGHGLGGLLRSNCTKPHTTYSTASLVGHRQFLHPRRRHVHGRTCFGSSYRRWRTLLRRP